MAPYRAEEGIRANAAERGTCMPEGLWQFGSLPPSMMDVECGGNDRCCRLG